jgi:hypothetical protein
METIIGTIRVTIKGEKRMSKDTCDYKKDYKPLYLPKSEPATIDVPEMCFFVIEGTGDPNGEAFSEVVGVLYSLSYTLKMMPKSGVIPEGYYGYTVFPLEGVWDVETDSDAVREEGVFGIDDKSLLKYRVMIRQPDFINGPLAYEVIEKTSKKKPSPIFERVLFERFTEGQCVQMMHIGAYDDEPASFLKMQSFCEKNGLKRKAHTHREIYLSDPRRVAPEKLKTVLRWQVTEA